MTWRERMVDFLFPPKCPFCRRVTEGQRVCPQCEKALPWTEGKDREQTLPGGLRCASPLWYEDLAREGILRFKFHGGAGAEALGALLADCAAERYSGEFDLVTWVPVSKKRRRKRATTRRSSWPGAPAASGGRSRSPSSGRSRTTPPSPASPAPRRDGPTSWASTTPRGTAPASGSCFSMTSSPPARPCGSAPGCCGTPGRRRSWP